MEQLIPLIAYLYVAFCIYQIAVKSHTDMPAFLAFVPIVNVVLLLSIADKPLWWILLLLIPIVNLVIIAVIWMGVSHARHKSPLLGLLIFVPFANLILITFLAFSD